MKQSNWLPCALSGAAAGFVNGFFGAGGGMLLVPLLIRLAKLEDRTAFSSSICIVLPMCLVSIAVYAANGMLPVREALPYLAGGAAGGVLAGLWFRRVPPRLLHLALGALIVFGGVRLLVC